MSRPWWVFTDARLARMAREKKRWLDIGGGLRIDTSRSNRHDTNSKIEKLLEEEEVVCRVLDYVDTYHPDIIGSVEDLPLPDNSEEAVVCLSVLEHVENPIKAAAELYRVVKPGGYCLVYVPFLYYYHAERNYYKDYWRFTHDSLQFIFKSFSTIEIQAVRGPIETLIRLSPLGRFKVFESLGYGLDVLTNKLASNQTSGYSVFLTK